MNLLHSLLVQCTNFFLLGIKLVKSGSRPVQCHALLMSHQNLALIRLKTTLERMTRQHHAGNLAAETHNDANVQKTHVAAKGRSWRDAEASPEKPLGRHAGHSLN